MAFSDVDIQFDSLDTFKNKGLVEFRVAATFSGPFVLDEEVVIEPNGQVLLLGAVAVADFVGDKIAAVRAYFDDATLLEQMLAGSAASSDPPLRWTAPTSLVVDRDPDPRDLALLEERLAKAAVKAVDVGEEREFGIFIRDDDQQVVAGASGSVWGGCCQVHACGSTTRGADVDWRERSWPRLEAEARRQGCRLVMGLTYEALTADFYDRLGYRTVGSIQDCPAGTTTRWYCKDL